MLYIFMSYNLLSTFFTASFSSLWAGSVKSSCALSKRR
jgi:hypothetical protein